MKKFLVSKGNLSDEDLTKMREKHEVVREDDKELVVMAEENSDDMKAHQGLMEMNEG